MRRMTSGRLALRMAARTSAVKAVEGDLVGGGVAADGGGEVLVAEVEDGVADFLGLLGDAGADAGAAERDLAAAGGEDLVGVAVDVEAEELAVLRVVAEDGGDGVVGADLLEADLHAGDVAGVDLGAVFEVGDVGFGLGEDAEELGFERRCAAWPKSSEASWRTRPA